MKRLSLAVFTLLLAFTSQAQAPKSPRVTDKTKNAVVEWGQPSKRGREVFGKLVPYGQVWRTGANQCTEIEFKKPVSFGGTTIRPGRYALFTIPNASEWVVILNAETDQWGSFNYNPEKDVVRVTVPVETLDKEVEALTLDLQAVKGDKKAEVLALMWDRTLVKVPLSY